jgi:hypothetical protein
VKINYISLDYICRLQFNISFPEDISFHWLGVVFGALLYMAQRPGNYKIGVEVFLEL